MSDYLTRYCAVHGEYEADSDGDLECDKCRAAGDLTYQRYERKLATLRAENEALTIERDSIRKDAALLAEQHNALQAAMAEWQERIEQIAKNMAY